MKSRTLGALILAACLLAAPVLADHASMPYAGQQTRTIKALSDEDIAALLKGEGMGMAKAAELNGAELNGYPGPAHVLTLAKELKLTETQRRQVQEIFDRMSAAAKPLGAELVERERVLDKLFATGEITPDRLAAETVAIGDLQARLRSVHLTAHVETRALLNANQIALYQQLRG
jgi:Spy/CpxP family protein refolding chaperone